MTHRTIAMIVGAVVLVAACGVAYEQRQQGGMRWARQHAFEHVDQALDGLELHKVLTSEQREALARGARRSWR